MLHILLAISLFGSPEDSLVLANNQYQKLIVLPISGEITLDDPWIVVTSIQCKVHGNLLPAAEWYQDDSLGVWKCQPIGVTPGDTITVSYRSAIVSPQRDFFYYEPALDTETTFDSPQKIPVKSDPFSNRSQGNWSGMKRSGTIVRGVKFGSGGNSGSSSGLHLELSGRPSPSVEVEAVVDDRNLGGGGASGNSSTLAELDRLFISAKTPHVDGMLGDIALNWSDGEYGAIKRRVKGGSVNIHNRSSSLEMAASGGTNRFATSIINVRDGDQGPYELVNRNGRSGVSLVAGSEEVRLDGRLLQRGYDGDYTADYDRGTILFHPSILINNNSRIEVRYEYTDDSYSKRLLALKSHTNLEKNDQKLSINVVVAEEGLDGEHPLSFEWTPESRARISEAGDNGLLASISGIEEVEPVHGDYVWGTSPGGMQILVFSTPDSLGHPTGNLRVNFTETGRGDYNRIYDQILLTYKYYWVGIDSGRYSPMRSLPLPDRTRLGVVRGVWSSSGFTSEAEGAVSDYDKNTLSSIDDRDNRAAAFSWRGGWVREDSLVQTRVSLRHEETGFRTLSAPEQIDFNYRWGLNESQFNRPETAIEGEAMLMPMDGLRFRSELGRLERGNDLTINRGGLAVNLQREDWGSYLGYEKISSRKASTNEKSEIDRLNGYAEGHYGIAKPHLSLRFVQERHNFNLANTQQYEGKPGVNLEIAKWAILDISYYYRLWLWEFLSTYYKFSESNSAQLGWKGSAGVAHWRSTILRTESWMSSDHTPTKSTSASISTLIGDYRSPVRFSGDYRLSTGNSRQEVVTAVYAGEGNGGYRFEDDRYVPAPDGEFNLGSSLTDISQFSTTVDFTGKFEWRPGKSVVNRSTATYPLGISRTTTRFDASVRTFEPDPVQVFLLDRSAFRSGQVDKSRWNWQQDVELLDDLNPGDGKLTLRREESRDATLYGGEELLLESALFRLRLRPLFVTGIDLSPITERSRRFGIESNDLKADVLTLGGDVVFRQSFNQGGWEGTFGVGRENREDRVSSKSVTESRLKSTVLRRLGELGSGRLEGEWRHITATSGRTGYDLLRGWYVGDNYTGLFSLDYRFGANLVMTTSLNSRWRPGRAALVDGLIELTASL